MNDRNLSCVRGDMLHITIDMVDENNENVEFKVNDVIRFKVFEKKNPANVVVQKDFVITTNTLEYYFEIPAEDMEIGELIDKPVDYWYEIELNPDTPQRTTIFGSDKQLGTPILTLLVEGGTK